MGYLKAFPIISKSSTAPMLTWFINCHNVGHRQGSELSLTRCLCSTCNYFPRSAQAQHRVGVPFPSQLVTGPSLHPPALMGSHTTRHVVLAWIPGACVVVEWPLSEFWASSAELVE